MQSKPPRTEQQCRTKPVRDRLIQRNERDGSQRTVGHPKVGIVRRANVQNVAGIAVEGDVDSNAGNRLDQERTRRDGSDRYSRPTIGIGDRLAR